MSFSETCTRLSADPDRLAAELVAAPAHWRAALRELGEGPDPAAALRRAAALGGDAPPSARLARVLHEGPYPAQLLSLDASAAEVLDAPAGPLPVSRDTVVEALTSGSPRERADVFGRVRTRQYLRLCAREVEGAPLEEVGRDLSTLAAAFVEGALRTEGIADRVCVFGMGKLGGDELNFLSDIDLVFVHPDELDRGDVVALHQRLRRVVSMLEGEGRWRPLWRVDLRLRPFGRTGPLSMSLRATEAYYERHGRDWERQVWIKGRPIAGAVDVGAPLLDRLRPFVYRRNVSPAIFGEIAALMERARAESPRGAHEGPDVKLDPGGIRQIEFAVQALQLLHGGRQPALRTASTLVALDRLLGAGLVSDREHETLLSSYRALRRIEHRIQLGSGRQTHRVPGPGEARELLRVSLTRGPAPVDLEDVLQHARPRVEQIAQTMSGEPVDDPRRRDTEVALDAGATQDARRAALGRLGLHDPNEAEALLAHLAAREDSPWLAQGPPRDGARALAIACLDSADPDAALAGLTKFAEHRGPHYAIWRAFADPAAQPAVRLAAELLGANPAVALGLVGLPVGRGALPDDSFDLLLTVASDHLPSAHEHADAWRSQPDDPRGLDARLLRFKHRQLAKVALFDLQHRPDPLAVGHCLSDLADLVVREVITDLAARTTSPVPFAIAMLAVGKYGMQGTDYGSDLDVMFVFEPLDGATTTQVQTPAIRFGQALVSRLTSRQLGPRLYEVDTRLRPSGRTGLLVTAAGGFEHYHAADLPVWERLANIRVRAIAEVRVGTDAPGPGLPATLSERCVSTVHASLGWSDDATAVVPWEEVSRSVRSLLDRIAVEVSRENRKRGFIDAKSGPGGCLELELLVGALQLHHAPTVAGARTSSVIEALAALGDADVLAPREARALTADYRFLRRLLNRLRLTRNVGGDDPDRFSQNSPRLVTLARRMGLVDASSLLDELEHRRDHVHRTLQARLASST